MLIGELVKICGLSKDTLRYYEDMGLIHSKPVQAGSRRYRDYDPTTLERLAMIALGKRMQFSLREIAAVLDGIINDQTTRAERRALMLAQIEQVTAKIADLEDVKRQLFVLSRTRKRRFANSQLALSGE